MLLKVGELAKKSGLTVRTLHHYDAIGLLVPSARADNGYRLYNRDDIARLHRIQALRGFGLSLADIGAYLAQPDTPLTDLVARQIAMLDGQIDEAARLRGRLQELHRTLMDGKEPELADWLNTLELMTMFDRYFSQEELDRLPMYHKTQTQSPEWTELVAQVRALMDAGVPPADERPRSLADRWMAMLAHDTNNDPRMLAKLNYMHDNEPAMQASIGISPVLRDYVVRAFGESKMAVYERYLSPEEFSFLRANYGKRAMEWPQLMADVRDAIDAGATPDSPQARELALRWMDLFRSYAGDDPATHAKFREALQNEPELTKGSWTDETLLGFMREAMRRLA
ncbi:MerR family transcriptional regulator [Paraburkholderia megapolitana]|uniref:Transcriptional regulator, MerR family n=1 Tax=Paraburkholderia megapolitana TaxID=420953 RepID=A0A1I3KRV8_9BURK|nr:MerR family transcriptional regulator [Paraburkholderia megapolitana]QDQ80431.1 MerR family transcriptional regulator [Paraburkholderia megapolitana]SFI75243.1 transcriptional regulator, MerR family [Paraburkholderia megapolitana]